MKYAIQLDQKYRTEIVEHYVLVLGHCKSAPDLVCRSYKDNRIILSNLMIEINKRNKAT